METTRLESTTILGDDLPLTSKYRENYCDVSTGIFITTEKSAPVFVPERHATWGWRDKYHFLRDTASLSL